MKRNTLFNIAIASAAGVAIIAAGCTRSSESAKNSGKSDVKSTALQSELLSVSATYPGYNGQDSCALTLSVDIDYPTQIGSADIAPLQTAIKDVVFDDLSPRSIEQLMDSFVTATDSYELNINPENSGMPKDLSPLYSYERTISLQRTSIDAKMVTYRLTDDQYLGGAHSMTYTRSFTYAIAEKEMLGLENLFVPDSMDIVFAAVNESLAAQFGVAKGELQQAGFFQNAVGVPNILSIENGAIVFHYNPYDIAPYSMGEINAYVYPITVESALTPMAKKLLME